MASDSERIARLEEIADRHTSILDRIDANVTSLMQSQSFMRGVWKTVIVIATAVSTVVGLFFTRARH